MKLIIVSPYTLNNAQEFGGYPIWRSEPIDFVRMYIDSPEPESEPIIPSWQKKPPEPKILKHVIDLYPTQSIEQPRDNFRITDDTLGQGGAKTRYKYNVDAIRTLQNIESEHRLATPDEQETLHRYVGWGAIPQAFDEHNPQWTDEYAELRSLLDDTEYAAVRASTLNAHYARFVP